METANKRLTKEFIKSIEILLENNWHFIDHNSEINYKNLKTMKNGVADFQVDKFKNTCFINYIEVESKNKNLEHIIIYKDEK